MPEVYAGSFTLQQLADYPVADAVREALVDWIAARHPEARGADLRSPNTIETRNHSIIHWEPFAQNGTELLDLTWRHPDQRNANVWWVTQATFLARAAGAKLEIRVLNTGPALDSGNALLTTRPRLLPSLLNFVTIIDESAPLRTEAEMLPADNVAMFARYVLLDPRRTVPVLLLTPDERGLYAVGPGALASEFVGLARVYCIAVPAATFALTGELGKRLSCYNGAARVYLPGFRHDTDPYRHPLLFPHRLGQKEERTRLAQWLTLLTTRRFRPLEDLEELRESRAIENGRRHVALRDELDRRRLAATQARDLRELLELAEQEVKELRSGKESLEAQLATARAKVEWQAAEIRRLQQHQESAGVQEGEQFNTPVFDPDSVEDAVRIAKKEFADALMFLPKAHESARESTYHDPGRVLDLLRTLAEVGQAQASGSLGRSLEQAFRDRGADYGGGISESTPKKLRSQHRISHGGTSYECHEHLKLGVSGDPSNCLRIYFTSRQRMDGKIVVGHVGRHLDTLTTT